MEIIQNRMKKTISIILLMVLLLSVTFPVFAATYTGSISKGDKLKFTGTSWTIYKTETAAKNLDKSNTNGTLKNGQEITVQNKSGNVLQIGTNKYIYYGSTAAKNFTEVTTTTKTPAKTETKADTPVKTETKVDTPSGSGLLEIGGAIIGGIFEVATSETTMGILSSIKDIIFGIIRTIIESIGNIGNASFDFPKTELPVVDVPSTSTEKVLKLNNTKATLDVGKTLILKATVDGKEVKPSYGSAKGSVATVDENGKITAKSAGTVEINAYYTYKDGLKNVDLKATCTVTVKAEDEKPSSYTGSIKRTDVKPAAGDWTTYCNNMAKNNNEWLGYIEGACKKYGVRCDTVMAMIYAESRGNNNVGINEAGYCGLMQVHYDSPSDLEPKNNIYKGAAELADKIKSFDGDERKGIQAYFSGVAGTKKKIKNGEEFSYYNKIVRYRNVVNELYTFN